MKKAAIPLIILLIFSAVSFASASVEVGPESGAGYFVNLTNPDGSFFYFDESNMSSYQYVHNMPDGWWVLQNPVVIDENWIIPLFFAFVAFSVAVIALVKRKNHDEQTEY